NDKAQELRVRFQVGHPPEVAERIRIKVGQGVTGRAVQTRQPVLVNDLTAEGNVINFTPGVRSELAVPLIAKNRVIGVLDVDELLKRIADLVTRIIDYQMFSILLLDPTGSVLQHRFSLRFKENVQLKHEVPLGVGLVGYAAQHGQAVLVPDVSKDPRYIPANPETRSELCIPLIYKDKVIGVLDIEHTRKGYFTEDHVRTMTTLAGQVAI